MGFSSFFSKQAQKPFGFFGKYVMATIFDIKNSKLNNFIFEKLPINNNDRVLEIGSGTGKLTGKILQKTDKGAVEAVDFSDIMISVSGRRNRAYIKKGTAHFTHGDFNEIPYNDNEFDKVCSVNTIYFWDKPHITAKKIHRILKPKGQLFIGFEQNDLMKSNKLDNKVFNFYSPEDVEKILLDAGFNDKIVTDSIRNGSALLHCIIATK